MPRQNRQFVKEMGEGEDYFPIFKKYPRSLLTSE